MGDDSERPRADILEIDSLGRRVMLLRIDPGETDIEGLTPAEREVASLAIQGLSNAEIATKRGTSVRTVEKQLFTVYRKLGLASRGELLVKGLHGSEEPRPTG
ncbi:MAG: helix-turn-helix domain-containing protein [Spirochaetaceae bacterium]